MRMAPGMPNKEGSWTVEKFVVEAGLRYRKVGVVKPSRTAPAIVISP